MSSISLIAFSLLGGPLAMQAGSLYSIQTLGVLGSPSAGVAAMNSNGVAAGYYADPSGNYDPASFNGSRTTLGSNGIASGINDSGTVVGTSYAGGNTQVVEWNNGRQTSLGLNGYGLAINNSGVVAGAYQVSCTQLYAFTYSNGVMTNLGTLGGNWSAAEAINNAGQVAGTSTLADGYFHAFFSQGGSLRDLGTLGGQNSYGLAINGKGEVAGTSQNAQGNLNAFLWNAGSMLDLGTLGGQTSTAYGVNDSGVVVGTSLTANNASDAFLYNNGTITDLNSLLPLSSGWDLNSADAINDAGDILATGTYQGQSFAVELKPGSFTTSTVATPEPAAIALVAVGLLALSRFGRKRNKQNV